MLQLKMTRARFAAGFIAATALALLPNFASAQSGDPIKIGFRMALTGPLAANGKQALLGAKIWEEETNKKGGLLGRPVKLVYLRRPEQSLDRSGHLHQAARRRQSRTRRRSLRDQDDRAGHAGRDAEGQDVHRPVRPRGEQRVQLSEILRDDPDGTEHEAVVHRRLLRRRGRRRIRSRRPSRWSPPTRSSRATPATARATTPRSTASRSSTTRPIRRPRPTSRRSCARSRRPTRTSSRSAPIRSTRSAWSRRSTSLTTSRR